MAPNGPIGQRRHFDLPEGSHPYHDYNPGDMPESTDVTPPAHNQSQPPAPIAQLAWLLHSILSGR